MFLFACAALNYGLHNELTGYGLCITQTTNMVVGLRPHFPFGSLLSLIYVSHHLGAEGAPPVTADSIIHSFVIFAFYYFAPLFAFIKAEIGGHTLTAHTLCLCSH